LLGVPRVARGVLWAQRGVQRHEAIPLSNFVVTVTLVQTRVHMQARGRSWSVSGLGNDTRGGPLRLPPTPTRVQTPARASQPPKIRVQPKFNLADLECAATSTPARPSGAAPMDTGEWLATRPPTPATRLVRLAPSRWTPARARQGSRRQSRRVSFPRPPRPICPRRPKGRSGGKSSSMQVSSTWIGLTLNPKKTAPAGQPHPGSLVNCNATRAVSRPVPHCIPARLTPVQPRLLCPSAPFRVCAVPSCASQDHTVTLRPFCLLFMFPCRRASAFFTLRWWIHLCVRRSNLSRCSNPRSKPMPDWRLETEACVCVCCVLLHMHVSLFFSSRVCGEYVALRVRVQSGYSYVWSHTHMSMSILRFMRCPAFPSYYYNYSRCVVNKKIRTIIIKGT